MLTERQNKMLKLIVERYIKDPTPVGSKVISKTFFWNFITLQSKIILIFLSKKSKKHLLFL